MKKIFLFILLSFLFVSFYTKDRSLRPKIPEYEILDSIFGEWFIVEQNIELMTHSQSMDPKQWDIWHSEVIVKTYDVTKNCLDGTSFLFKNDNFYRIDYECFENKSSETLYKRKEQLEHNEEQYLRDTIIVMDSIQAIKRIVYHGKYKRIIANCYKIPMENREYALLTPLKNINDTVSFMITYYSSDDSYVSWDTLKAVRLVR